MSTLTSYKDGSLGANHMQAFKDGSLSGPFSNMTSVSGYKGMQTVSGVGCGCQGVGEYFSSGLGADGDPSFIEKYLDTTPKKVGAAAVGLLALYFVAKKTKLIKNPRRSRRRRSRR